MKRLWRGETLGVRRGESRGRILERKKRAWGGGFSKGGTTCGTDGN